MAVTAPREYLFSIYRETSAYKKEVEELFNGQIATHYGSQDVALKRIYDATDRKCELLFRHNVFQGVIAYKTGLQNRDVSRGVTRSIEIKNIALLNPNSTDRLLFYRMMLRRIEQQTASLKPEGMFMIVSNQDTQTRDFLTSCGFVSKVSWENGFAVGVRAELLYKPCEQEQEVATLGKRGVESQPAPVEEKRGRMNQVPATQNTSIRPSKNHTIPLKIQYLNQIISGRKTVEGRIDTGMMKGVKEGDTVSFFSGNTRVSCRVTKVNKYRSFSEMLQSEGVSKCLADVTDLNAGIRVYHSIPKYQERAAQFGVLAWQLEVIR